MSSTFPRCCLQNEMSLFLETERVMVFVHYRSDLTASSGMASTLQQLASSSQWQPSIADHVGLCLERLAEPAEVLLVVALPALSKRFVAVGSIAGEVALLARGLVVKSRVE